MRTLQFIWLIAGTFLLMASTCRPLINDDVSKMTKRIEMSKGPCFGSCPVFTLTIYEEGLATYEGQRFTDRMGLHTKRLDQETLRAVIREFEEADMWRYQNSYKAQIPDLPTVTITYHEEENSKTVKGKDGRPEKIVELEAMLDAIANSGGWEQQGSSGNYGLEEDVIANELIVNLSSEVDPNVWVIQFAKQEMRIKNRISPNSPYWVFTFNPSIMSPQEMMGWVRQDAYVLSAEFNRRVQATGRN